MLLHRAEAEAIACNLAALRLWTGKPRVYQGHGFVIADNALYGWIEKPGSWTDQGVIGFSSEHWPSEHERRRFGLPPFAIAGRRWRSNAASLITLEDGHGSIVAEWTGSNQDVAQLMEHVLSDRSRLNALDEDELPEVLRQRGWRCALTDSQLQMVRPLSDEQSPQQWAKLHTPRVLERI